MLCAAKAVPKLSELFGIDASGDMCADVGQVSEVVCELAEVSIEQQRSDVLSLSNVSDYHVAAVTSWAARANARWSRKSRKAPLAAAICSDGPRVSEPNAALQVFANKNLGGP